jgi:hypothetical protein
MAATVGDVMDDITCIATMVRRIRSESQIVVSVAA